jgi:endonuclease YncB( thermonuclease family)
MKKKPKIIGAAVVGIFAILIVIGFAVGPQSDAKPTPISEVQNEPSAAASSQAIQPDLVKVLSVVDGDTLKVSTDGSEKTIRLIGIDTPEVVDPRKPVECFGKEASAKAKEVLTGQMVRLEADPSQGNLDKYQRLLRYVFLTDGIFYNEMMITEGYAHEYTYDTPYKYQAEFKAAEKSAREAQLGLWSPATCNGVTASTTPKATAVVVTAPVHPQSTQLNGHVFYLSTYYTSKYYYCDTDPGWQSLSKQYLKSYPSEQALLSAYPNRTLHAACE